MPTANTWSSTRSTAPTSKSCSFSLRTIRRTSSRARGQRSAISLNKYHEGGASSILTLVAERLRTHGRLHGQLPFARDRTFGFRDEFARISEPLRATVELPRDRQCAVGVGKQLRARKLTRDLASRVDSQFAEGPLGSGNAPLQPGDLPRI